MQKLALVNAVGQRIPMYYPPIPWLVKHAADVVNRFLVMSDGATAFERVEGWKSSAEMHEFALPVMHRVSGKSQWGGGGGVCQNVGMRASGWASTLSQEKT